jgi:hypothetical protein
MIDLIRFRQGKVIEVEVFLQDTNTLMDTLARRVPPYMGPPVRAIVSPFINRELFVAR